MTKTIVILAFAAFIAYIGWGALAQFEAAQANRAAQIEGLINGR